MRKIAIFILSVYILFTSTGCNKLIGGRGEIVNISFISVAALDILEDDSVRLTVVSKKSSVGTDGGSEEKQAEIMSSEGSTVFESVRNLSSFSNKKSFWGHVEFILIGEAAAKEGLLDFIDFFVRDHELRLNARVVVVKGTSAEEVIRSTKIKDYFISDRLKGLFENKGARSISSDITLMDLAQMLDKEYLCPCLPFIELVEKIQKDEQDKDKKDIELKGYALFKSDKLELFIEGNEARGYNWVRGRIQSGIIVVQDTQGSKVSLEIINSTSKIIPTIENGELTITIKIGLSSNIGEVKSSQNVFHDERLLYIQNQQNEVVKSEIEKVITLSQSLGIDVLGIGDAVFHKYPIEWELYKTQWKSIYPDLKFEVFVTSKISRTYDIKEPLRKGGGS